MWQKKIDGRKISPITWVKHFKLGFWRGAKRIKKKKKIRGKPFVLNNVLDNVTEG